MEDRFKFRAWDTKDKCFYVSKGNFDWHVDPDGDGFIEQEDNESGYDRYSDEFTRYILTQSTGKKDKNGKLIFEGDIVQDSYTKLIPSEDSFGNEEISGETIVENCEIIWEDYGIHVRGKTSNYRLVVYMSPLEIIGNIYENPELLSLETNPNPTTEKEEM